MDERRLEVFRAVAAELNFSRAALSLHLSQSAVSQQIAALEHELGGALFDRSRRRVRLTPAGATLQGRVDGLLGEFAEARRLVAAARGEVAGELRVVASRTVGTYLLSAPIAELGRRHPDLRLRLRIENSERVVRALPAGQADVGYVEDTVSYPGVVLEPLFDDELVVVAAGTHRFARLAEVAPEDLAAEPIVAREPGSGTRRVAEEQLRAAGVRPEALRVVAELAGIEAIKGAVEAGLGVAILSRLTLRKELALGTLVARPLAGVPMRRTIFAMALAGGTELPAARRLTELLAASARSGRDR